MAQMEYVVKITIDATEALATLKEVEEQSVRTFEALQKVQESDMVQKQMIQMQLDITRLNRIVMLATSNDGAVQQ